MNNLQLVALIAAVEDVYRAAMRADEEAYDAAVLVAYDHALDAGLDDIAEALGDLPVAEFASADEAASQVLAIQQQLSSVEA